MWTIEDVTAVLGKDFHKLDGFDDYSTWSKEFTRRAFLAGLGSLYNGEGDIIGKPARPDFLNQDRTVGRTTDNSIAEQAGVPIPVDAAAQLDIYNTLLELWKDYDKDRRFAIVMLRRAVQPWMWKEINEEHTCSPHLAYAAITRNNKAPNYVLLDRALTKINEIKLTDFTAIRPDLSSIKTLCNDVIEAEGTISYSQLIIKINHSLPVPEYQYFIFLWNLQHNISEDVTKAVYQDYQTRLVGCTDSNKECSQKIAKSSQKDDETKAPTRINNDNNNRTNAARPAGRWAKTPPGAPTSTATNSATRRTSVA
ncbi:hypothetical protein FB567DRAFT_544013 [Paraphoma chrysanthemicola]|uniref:Uncharacterized protein n=1 Tax=Paraphoma chrysanthemicola TaxID=798071 RepID=A0A8K0W4I9_9PLEO|nr:hypothetical protein FB567DRAFT_544013 [Paraphoma chrysanthemicola]